MKDHAVFDKALRLLVHPIPLTAMGLYALNTLALQHIAPNWLTGKLGDFCWILVAPLALTAILSRLLPERAQKYAFPISILSIGLIFSLIKATDLNTMAISSLRGLLGRPVSILQDESDLPALTAMAVTMWLWHRPQTMGKTSRPAGTVLIGLLTLVTIADAVAPNLGIMSIEFADQTILACGGFYSNMQSNDGGQTWQASQEQCTEPIYSPMDGQVIQDPGDERIQYRFKPGLIERSTDGGLTWQADYRWELLSEAEQLYYTSSQRTYNANVPPPFSGAVNPATGEAYFAMGHEGILKREAGESPSYHWLAVGKYKRIEYQKNDLLFALLSGEWMLAVCAGCAGVTLLDIRLKPGKIKTALLILGLIGMAACALVFPPAPTLAQPYFSQFLPMGLMILLLWMLALTANGLYNAGMNSKGRLFLSIAGFLVITILTIVPFVLWVYNVIPHYQNALLTAGIVAIVSLIGLQVLGKRMAPVKRLQV
jgi:hypothetical protein